VAPIGLAIGLAFGLMGGPVLAGPVVSAAPVTAAPRLGAPPTTTRMPFEGSAGKQGPAVSLDWAGYSATGPPITTVSGSWTQPAANCSTTKANQSAYWVGIDGFAPTDTTVQQVGTDADCSKGTKKVPSKASYYAWFEMYPGPLVVLNTASYPLLPTDVLTASVTQVGASYQLVLNDATHWTFSTLQPVSKTPLDASGEWIVEAPTTCKGTRCTPVLLTNFGSVAFTGATANGQPVDGPGFTPHQITMSKNKKGTIVKAATSALAVGGTAFGVTWVSS
jgi:hypothetical protein